MKNYCFIQSNSSYKSMKKTNSNRTTGKQKIKTKIVSTVSSASGISSILGSWQICHSICLWTIALLAIIGIAVSGMPLFFLTTIAIPLWLVAMALYLLTGYWYLTKKCISKKMLFFNGGIIIAGVPFSEIEPIRPLLWIIGGALVLVGILLLIKERMPWRCKHET